MAPAVDGIAAGILGAIILVSALGMLTTKNVVHAAYWMLAAMLGSAGMYMLLDAGFLAMVQVMVYAGAVAVLLIFVIMLTLRRREDAIRSRDFSVPALSLAVVFAAVAAYVISGYRVAPGAMPKVAPGILEFGQQLFTTWMLPFELASLLLTVALVGAVWWSNGGDKE